MKIVEKLSLYLYGGFEFVFENVERIEFVVVGLSSKCGTGEDETDFSIFPFTSTD